MSLLKWLRGQVPTQSRLKWSISLFLIAIPPGLVDAQQQCANGGCEPPTSLQQVLPVQQGFLPTNNLSPFKAYTINGDYVVAGVGVRGSGVATIPLFSVPAGAQAVAAYLYWETLGNGQTGSFSGHVISGIPLGTVTSPCWSPPLITVYRADVTSYLNAGGNGNYPVAFPDSGNFNVAPSTEGVSLLIVYRRSDLPPKAIVIYDGAYTQTNGTPTFDLTLRGFTVSTSVSPQGKLTHIVGDGQPFSETMTIDGTVFGSLTNPFGGFQGPLWDNPTFDISSLLSPGATSVTTSVRWPSTPGNPNDCLTWGAVALSTTVDGAGSSAELLDPVSELLAGPNVIVPGGASNISILATKGVPRAGVAADGVAKLVVRINAPSPGTFTFAMTDENGIIVPQSSDQYGALTDLYGQAIVSIGTYPTAQGNKTWALYTAPKRFFRHSPDAGLPQRTVFLKPHFTPAIGGSQDLPRIPVTIVRPPVMLVHGLWSSETAWIPFPLSSSRDCATDSGLHYTCRIDYRNYSASKFAVVAPLVGQQIRDNIAKFKVARNVAAIQADLIGHSMGGLIARVLPLCGTQFQDCLFGYRTNTNFNQGDIGRLITIGSPHQGSPLATALWTNRNVSCGPLPFWGTLASNFAAANTPIGGAVEDMQPGSGAIGGLNGTATPYPLSFVAGAASRSDELLFNSGLIDAVRSCDDDIVPADSRDVFGEDSDLVVAVTSQRYALGPGAVGTHTYLGTIHSPSLAWKNQTGFSPGELNLATLGSDAVSALDTGVFIRK